MNLNIFPYVPKAEPSLPHVQLSIWQWIDELAIAALYDELNLEYKPGLVCPSSNGSHQDMDYATFVASIESLRGYFAQLASLGYQSRPFVQLQQAGLLQEQKMRHATQNINTHKGAIFNLGFCCAAIGQCLAHHLPITSVNICEQLIQHYQYAITHQLARQPHSHGQQMYQKYGLAGAIELVANGFEIVQTTALPCLYHTLTTTKNYHHALTQTLFALIAQLPDTNLAWRGGLEGLALAQGWAGQYLTAGGVLQDNDLSELNRLCQQFVQYNLSPGGSADLLAVTIFLFRIENEFSDFI